MNIFVLDLDPVKAAQYQCDKHVVKMVLETAQILCTAFDNAPYKKTHFNHPSCVWARQSRENYEWLIKHGIALADEYEFRYNKKHKSLQVIKWCNDHISEIEFPEEGLTPFAQALPEEYRNNDPVVAYRKYYRMDKSKIAKWKNGQPSWW